MQRNSSDRSEERPVDLDPIRAAVGTYYTDKFKTYGATAPGVDWSSDEAQLKRFDALLQMIEETEGKTLLDYGCGYGLLCPIINARFPELKYSGYNLSAEMLACAAQRGTGRWLSELPEEIFDYVVASGIFNVRLGFTDVEWRAYVECEMKALFLRARKGLAFNFIPLPTEGFEKLPHLFYFDPLEFADWCGKNLSANVQMLSGYGLHDMTFIIRPGETNG